jgi:hypothetical protein
LNTYVVDSQDTRRLGDQGNDRVDGLEKEGLFVAETNGLENVRSIVLNDGDTSHLNRELKDDTEEHSPQVGRNSEDLDADVSGGCDTLRILLTSTHPERIWDSAVTFASISAYSAWTKVSEVSPRACSRARTWSASSFRPLIMSHRGDYNMMLAHVESHLMRKLTSGNKKMRQARGTAGAIWNPRGKRHWNTVPLWFFSNS